MRALLTLALIVGTVSASWHAWKTGSQYKYELRGRTLAGLHQVSNQFSGILLKGWVVVQPYGENTLNVRVSKPQYADLHANLSSGWSTYIPDSSLSYKPLPLTDKPFELKLKNGVVDKIIVDQSLPIWEVNMLKGIASQLQVDTQAQNLKKSRINQLPADKNQPRGVYKTMEDSVTGECETLYDISSLPEYVIQNKPMLAPLLHLRGEGHYIDIVKTMNYSNCDQRKAYHFGLTGSTDWEPASSQMGNMLSRTSVQRVVISGTLDRYAIQSSVTTNKIIIAPHLHNAQKGILVSRINLTLEAFSSASGAPQTLSNPRVLRTLVYNYNTASQENNFNNYPRTKASSSSSSSSKESASRSRSQSANSRSSQSSDTSSSENSSNENLIQGQKISNRARRSVNDDCNENRRGGAPFKPSSNKPEIRKRSSSSSDSDVSSSSSSDDNSSSSSNPDKSSSSSNSGSNKSSSSSSRDDSSSRSSGAVDFNTPGKPRGTGEHGTHNPSKPRSSSNSPSSRSLSSSGSSSSDSSSSSSSSSSDSRKNVLQKKPSLTLPPNPPFLPEFVGEKGNSIHSSHEVNITNAVIKLAQKIASEIQNPNVITGEHTLTSFNFLSELISTMRHSQIEEIGDRLYFPKNLTDPNISAETHKHLTWVTFRDAVAEAGTGPAFVAIKHWILRFKVKNEEAAQLISVLPKALRYPTQDYMKEFFALVTSPTVKDQLYLNATAIHSFSDLMRMVQSKREQHNRFPVHSFEKFIGDKALNHLSYKYFSYLSKQLKISVAQGDSHKIQVYIRALGNSAQPKILKVLEPYLEGKQQITAFQRLVIVASLDKMAQVHPRLVRPVFYRIYLNTREAPELRVAAVMQLMKTNPPAEILQRMAEYTNREHSKQVNSAVKSAIESAARLMGPHNQQLAMNAKSAVNFLTPRQYGSQYSKNYIKNFISEHIVSTLKLTSVQSDDSTIPSSVFYVFGRKIGGFIHPCERLIMMTSSADELLNLLSDQFSKYEGTQQYGGGDHSKSGLRWTAEKISNMLNISLEEADQVEGNIRITWAGIDKFITFDNNTIEQLPSMVSEVASTLKNGKNFNYTKMLNQYTIKIGFPTDMGLPFVYSLQVPTLMSIEGEAQIKTYPDLSNGAKDQIQQPQTVNVTAEIKMMYASKTQAKLGFVTPFSHQHYFAGYDSNIQINLPFRVNVDIDVENTKVGVKLQPLDPSMYQKLAEYSTLAYTTQHKIIDISPPQLDKNAEIVHVRPVQRFEVTAGQQNTGFAFDLKAETEQKYFDSAYFMEGVQKNNLLTAILHYNKHQTIKPNTNYTLSFNPQKTSAEFAKIVVNYHSNATHAQNGGLGDDQQNGAIPTNASPDSQKRVQQFLNRVSSGIQDATVQAVDVSLEFNGETNSQYIATAAYGRSYASHKSRILVFLSKDPAKTTSENRPYQIAMDVVTHAPKVPLTHFKKAMEADPTSSVYSTINFGEKAESGGFIKLKSKLKQSREFREHLEQVPLAIECEKQMSTGNYILPACRNVTARANFLDKYSITVEYSGVPDVFQNLTYQVFSALREMAYTQVSENIMVRGNKEGQINLDASFSPDLSSANLSIDTSRLNVAFTNLHMGKWSRAIAVFHPEYNMVQRLGQITMRSQQYPTCAMDKSFATTFDNKTYPITLGKCWHVMVQSTPYYRNGLTNEYLSPNNSARFSILVRDIVAGQREVMLILDENVLTLLPTAGSAADHYLLNGQKYTIYKDSTTHYTDKEGHTVVKAYKLPSGSLRVLTPMHGFEIIYDGLRVKLQIPNGYRSKVRGLCGNFDGEKSTDFMTPQNCILKNPLEFSSTYAIADQSCEALAVLHLRQHAQTAICHNKTVAPGDVISNLEAGRHLHKSSPTMKSSKVIDGTRNNKVKQQNGQETCGVYATLIIHRAGFKCFSKTPQLQCLGACQKPVTRVTKQLEFFCLSQQAGQLINSLSNIPKSLQPTLIPKLEGVWVPLQCE